LSQLHHFNGAVFSKGKFAWAHILNLIYTAGQYFGNTVEKICITDVYGHFHELIRRFIDSVV
jgi:hypothetical protein